MTIPRTLAHLSDLHFGRSTRCHAMAQGIVGDLLRARIDHVVVTGDITHRGRHDEYEAFLDVFSPLLEAGRLSVVPGNHDRSADDVGSRVMNDRRVEVEARPGLYLVKVDSTGPHNRFRWQGHGEVTPSDLREIAAALRGAPADALVVVLMHHHPYPLPEEGTLEWLSAFAGLPYAAELHCGNALLDVVATHSSVLLHGHRHVPSERFVATPRGGLQLFNAGSSTSLGRCRILTHAQGVLRRRAWHHFTRPSDESSWLERVIPAATG